MVLVGEVVGLNRVPEHQKTPGLGVKLPDFNQNIHAFHNNLFLLTSINFPAFRLDKKFCLYSN